MNKSCLENSRYREMQVKEGVYVPDLTDIFSEEDSFKHLVPVNKVPGLEFKFDETYTYLDDSKEYLKERNKCYNILWSYVFLANPIKYGLRIKGREILKKYKKEFENGAITICNHMYRWDVPAVLQAIRYRKVWVPVYGENLMTKDHWFIKYIGGIPVPETMGGLKKFNDAFDELHKRKEWFHVFPEECRWDYYKPIRPFRKGAFSMAYKYNMPILPCCITYRKRTGLYKLFGNQKQPLLTITIGEPIFPKTDLPRKIEVDRLREVAHKQMVEMAGIKKNTWPVAPTDNDR